MTVEEKRKAVQKYCSSKGVSCEKCVLSGGDWAHKCKGIGGVKDCLHIRAASEEELDRALVLINGNTDAEFIGCEYCKYMCKGENEPPCLFCKHNKKSGSEEYMTAPELYEPLGTYAACAVLPVKKETEGRGENMKVKENQLCTIELEVLDNSCMSVAHAICKYYTKSNSVEENALIDLDEVAEHIDAYVRAERKALEYKKLAEEG